MDIVHQVVQVLRLAVQAVRVAKVRGIHLVARPVVHLAVVLQVHNLVVLLVQALLIILAVLQAVHKVLPLQVHSNIVQVQRVHSRVHLALAA